MIESQEPKYGIDEFGRLVNRITCKAIPDDEPIFILRAKDKNALLAIAFYKKLCANEQHKEVVNERLHSFVKFAFDNPEKLHEPTSSGERNEQT